MAVINFDYVIVGAGSAGCVLANRLSADGRSNVLLIEAGPRDTDFWIHVPLGYGKLFARTDVNWAYESEPEPNLNGRRIFTPRGKVLGGSSSINGLVYIRGQREDFDAWGVPGWTFNDLLPYFKKTRIISTRERVARCRRPDQRLRHPRAARALRRVHRFGDEDRHPAQRRFQRHHSGGHRLLSGRRRATAAVAAARSAYLRPAEKRSNLRVEIEALAHEDRVRRQTATAVVVRSSTDKRTKPARHAK